MSLQKSRVAELYALRPRSPFLRISALGLLLLVVVSWQQLDIRWSDLVSETRWANLQRFAGEVYPFALRDERFELPALGRWFQRIWTQRGRQATAATFSISVVAMVLAGLTTLTVLFPAARNVATPEPFLPGGRVPTRWHRWWWNAVVFSARTVFVLARSIPEYIWAFLLLALLGPSAWPAILALALHNFGILGKLGAEVVENLDPSPLRALRAQGLSRAQICLVGIMPASLSKWLLFFFYRWETCVREATVLGMLGITSLGFWVRETRARDWYDEMLLFILLGAGLVLLVDLASALTRRYLRRA